MSSTVTLAHVEKEVRPMKELPTVPAPEIHLSQISSAIASTGVCLLMTLLSPVIFVVVMVLGAAKSMVDAFKTELQGSWYH